MKDYTHLADQLRDDADWAEANEYGALADHLRLAATAIDSLTITANNYRKALEAMR